MHSDEILWKGMLRGDQEMFVGLYKRYYQTLLLIGTSRVDDSQSVKDAIHHLFLYLWENRNCIHLAKNVRSYLITSFLRTLNGQRSVDVSTFRAGWNESFGDSAPTSEEKLISKEVNSHPCSDLAADIVELPRMQRQLLSMRFYDGYSYEQIVHHTGLSHQTVYNKIHEALKKLRLDVASDPVSKVVLF